MGAQWPAWQTGGRGGLCSWQDKDPLWVSRSCLQNGGLGSGLELLVHGGGPARQSCAAPDGNLPQGVGKCPHGPELLEAPETLHGELSRERHQGGVSNVPAASPTPWLRLAAHTPFSECGLAG